MSHRLKQNLESLIDHYAAFCLALAVVILSLIGVGDVRMTGLVGLFLCGVGMTRNFARVDLRILLPLVLYDLAAMASSYMAYGTIVDGYGAMHAVFPVIYLLTACLDAEELRLLRRCCVLWAGGVAAAGIGRFVFRAVVSRQAGRMAGLLGNANAMGIFLVIGWFALIYCFEEDRGQGSGRFLLRMEPILLIALALTLSMGSFLAMAAGIAVLLAGKKRDASVGETFRYACRLLARASWGMGTGVLLYLAAARISVPWLCLLLPAYGVAMAACWNTFENFLKVHVRTSLMMSVLGISVAVAVMALRPSAVSTFAERLEMMESGIGYLAAAPLFGVGPFWWRILDLNDGGTYFNTWHIHNIPIHVGVEMGWFAMAMVIFLGFRALSKKKAPSLRAGTAAFLFHNLMDTSFFYLGITAFTLAAAGEPEEGGRSIGSVAVKVIFALFAGLFAYSLYRAAGGP